MSSFIRKRVRGLLKTTFSTGSNNSEEKHQTEPTSTRNDGFPENSVLYEKILNGRNRKKADIPETYSGKTGLDLPVIHLGKMSKKVKSCFTGPDGGLTKVQQMRQQPICRMANLDDELSLSSFDDEEEDQKKSKMNTLNVSNGGLNNSKSLEALGFLPGDLLPSCSTETYDWASSNHHRSFGYSISLYEKHPITGVHAGTPIADVFGTIARENNAVLALADGVNWGEGARLAARCAIRGALDHLNQAIESNTFETTTDVFHSMLGAFHAGHSLILQEGGALTTLCVALVAPIKNSDTYVLCVCNVGDSLCFVFNPAYGVREVTLASHDIAQMRDMRDAGGALGPVDGRNPQLHNLTCSMTFVQEGDLIFITSDGVSDNFDPVVGKFSPNGPLNIGIPQRQRCNAVLPCVDSFERHELMLLRMADIITNGIKTNNTCNNPYGEDTPESGLGTPSSQNTMPSPNMSRNNPTTAFEVCKNLVTFAQQLSQAKRKTLEDPELYRTRTHSKTEERLRRKMVRSMIMEMPGKLDHASVVAFKVGEWDPEEDLENNSLDIETPIAVDIRINEDVEVVNIHENEVNINNTSLFCKPSEFLTSMVTIINEDEEKIEKSIFKLDLPPELEPDFDKALSQSPQRRITRSPYEDQPIVVDELCSPTRVGKTMMRNKKNHHGRGSAARHTLGVDITWLKKLVTNKSNEPVDLPLAAHSSKVNSQLSVAESPVTPTSPGSRLQRPSFSIDTSSRQFSLKKFFMKNTKSEAQVLPPLRSPNRG
ncbi:hypothetical protein FO519_004634 [Halicephalobus sp. NKZ332]|nr:hypothetical protein FO519_004634 [Halicephalobus sp. NKZ332]